MGNIIKGDNEGTWKNNAIWEILLREIMKEQGRIISEIMELYILELAVNI